MFDIPDPLEAMSKPETVSPVRVPTLVMLVWAACETTRATLAFATFPTRFDEFRFEIPDPLETMSKPWTFRPVRVPTEVILGWDAWDTTRATLALATFPTRFEEFRFEIPDPFEAISNPWTFRPVKVPTDVMLGWAACETTRATLAFATFPTRFEELRAYMAAPFEYTFDTTTYEGKSALTRARNEGAPAEPTEGPAKT